MKDKLLLFIGYIFILAGAIKFDLYIYPTLDYFGKYVAIIVLNLFPFIVGWKLNNKYPQYISLVWGIIWGLFFYKLA